MGIALAGRVTSCGLNERPFLLSEERIGSGIIALVKRHKTRHGQDAPGQDQRADSIGAPP